MMTLPLDKCPACGEGRDLCRTSPLSEGFACCPSCRANGYHADAELEVRYVPVGGPERENEGDGVVDVESRIVQALVKVAERAGPEEHAVLRSLENRGDEDDDEAAKIAREHGWDDGRLVALRGLARSRDVSLERVIRAALRGELRDIVELPPVARVT